MKHTTYRPLEQGIVTGRYYTHMAQNPQFYFDDWYNMHIRWIRIEFEEFMYLPDGLEYEDARVQENVANYARIIEEAHTRGIQVLGVIGINSMRLKKDFPESDESIANYLDCVGWHLRTYAVDAIEICNEPGGFYCHGNTRLDLLPNYGRVMIETYTVYKALYPHVIFAAPVTANAEAGEWLGYHGWPDVKFIPSHSIFNNHYMQEYRDMHEGKLPLDVVSWHPYGTGGNPKDDTFYFGRSFATYYDEIKGYKDIQGRPIIGDYPVWFTEYNWVANWIGQDSHQRYYEGMLELMRERPEIEVALLYTYRDDEMTPDSEFKCLGLLKNSRNSFEKRKTYYSFFANNSGVGLTAGRKTSTAIITAYIAHGGRRVLGTPCSCTEYVGSDGWIQEFKDKASQPCAILQKQGWRRAYLIAGAFYEFFRKGGGVDRFGWPVMDEVNKDRKHQEFEKGVMVWDAEEVVFKPADSPQLPSYDMRVGMRQIGDEWLPVETFTAKYDFFGEQKMGKPTGAITGWHTEGWVQEFSGGDFGNCLLFMLKDAQDALVIRGDILEHIRQQGGFGQFGMPISDPYEENGTLYQDFARGIVCSKQGQIRWIDCIGRLMTIEGSQLLPFVQAYERFPHSSAPGVIKTLVRYQAPGVLIQEFKAGWYGENCAIMMKEKKDTACILKERFFEFYFSMTRGMDGKGGVEGYGVPLGDSYEADGKLVQDFEYGRMALADGNMNFIPYV